MFESIGTFTVQGGRFNNTTGDQFNTNVAPSSGLLGPADPQWPVSSAAKDAIPPNRRAITAPTPMFAHIDKFEAEDTSFNNNEGNQYNYFLSDGQSLQAPRPQTAFPAPAANVPHSTSAPPAPVPATPELTPSLAQARMFGSISRLDTVNSEFNNSTGTQINVHASRKNRPNSSTAFGTTANKPRPLPSTPTNNPFLLSPHVESPNVSSEEINQSIIDPSILAPLVPPGTNNKKPSKISFFKRKDLTQPREVALGITDYVLTTLQSASRFSGVPFLPEAATAALSILQGVQGAKDNQGGFARLAAHGCNLISSVIVVYEERRAEGKELAPELMKSLGELVQKLRPIAKFVEEMKERHGFGGNLKKVILHKYENNQVQEYREKLTQALAEFGLRSNISVQDGVAQIDRRLEELVVAMKAVGLQSPRSGTLSLPPSRPASRAPSTSSANRRSTPSPVPEEPVVLPSGPASAPASAAPTAPIGAFPSPYLSPNIPFSAPVTPPVSMAPNGSFYAMGSVINNVSGSQTNTSHVHNVTLNNGGEYLRNAMGIVGT